MSLSAEQLAFLRFHASKPLPHAWEWLGGGHPDSWHTFRATKYGRGQHADISAAGLLGLRLYLGRGFKVLKAGRDAIAAAPLHRDLSRLPLIRRLYALGFSRQYSDRDPLQYVWEGDKIRIQIQLWRDGKFRVSHGLYSRFGLEEKAVPTVFNTLDEMLPAIIKQLVLAVRAAK